MLKATSPNATRRAVRWISGLLKARSGSDLSEETAAGVGRSGAPAPGCKRAGFHHLRDSLPARRERWQLQAARGVPIQLAGARLSPSPYQNTPRAAVHHKSASTLRCAKRKQREGQAGHDHTDRRREPSQKLRCVCASRAGGSELGDSPVLGPHLSCQVILPTPAPAAASSRSLSSFSGAYSYMGRFDLVKLPCNRLFLFLLPRHGRARSSAPDGGCREALSALSICCGSASERGGHAEGVHARQRREETRAPELRSHKHLASACSTRSCQLHGSRCGPAVHGPPSRRFVSRLRLLPPRRRSR